MSDWAEGYITDIGYTYGYYNELNPQRIKLAFLNAGLQAPKIETACELGFGQGLSLNIHAAATTIKWRGNDFNPSQVAFAQDLKNAAGSDLLVFDDSFQEYANRSDLPEFDFIGLHGIWSWINDENRHALAGFIRRKLKVGGVLYISYNALPGWSAFMPIRHLLTEHASRLSADASGVVAKVDSALEFAERLVAGKSAYIRANPAVADRLSKLKQQGRHYLAHEYFNRDWKPFYFSEIASQLSSAKLDFACSAHYLDGIPALNLTSQQQLDLSTIQDKVFQETYRDYLVNQGFRRDYWVKGARRLSVLEQTEQARAMKLILATAKQDVSLEITGPIGKSNMAPEIYNPILTFLSDHKIHTIGEIETHVSPAGVKINQILQAITILAGSGHIHLATEEVCTRMREQTINLNARLIQKSIHSDDIAYLASPVTGGGIPVSRFEQLFLIAIGKGKPDPDDWAQYCWDILNSQGQKILKDGKALATADENLRELKLRAKTFIEKQLPILRSLEIAK